MGYEITGDEIIGGIEASDFIAEQWEMGADERDAINEALEEE